MAKVTVARAIFANVFRDNGATVVFGGNIDSSSTVTNAPDTVVITRPAVWNYGSRVPGASSTSGTKTAIDGTFAVMAAGNYIIKASNQDQIAGTTVALLRTPANVIATYRKAAVRARFQIRTIIISSWNYATGTATISSVGADTVLGADGVGQANYRVVDDAANPTLAVPGELTFNLQPAPFDEEYAARTHS